MSHYDVTKARILQWLGIILIMAVFSGAYWYFKVYGSTLNQSQNDLNTNGLVGLWSFNGDDISGTTAYDRSGSGNNGTLTNGPTVTQGKVGQALSFDGTDDYVSVGDTAIFEPAQNITLTAWIYPTGNGSYPGIITKSASNGESLCKYSFYLYSTTRRLSFAMGGSSVQSVNLIAPLNEWSFVAVTQDGSSLKLYLNGNSETFSTLPAPSYSTETLKIGTWTGSGQSFPGRIDEVRVYNRAITASEVTSLYTQGGGTKVNTAVSQPQGTGRLDSGLAGYWKMDDGSGTSATDSSTNAYTGTLTSGPTWTTGQIGGAVSFDGVDDYIDTNNGTVLDSLSEYTYATWIYPTSANGFIIAKASNGGGSSGFRLTSSTLQGWRANFTGWTAARSTSTTTVSLNTWSHAVITYSHVGDKKQHIYLNGVEVAYSEQDTNPIGLDPDSSYDFWIGRKEGGNEMADVPFTGHIDEARIYNRALSVDEVSQLYRLTSPTGVDTSLKGYWSFNAPDMASTTAYDRSGAGNSGTLTNGPVITEGKLGQALSFNGSTQYVTAGDPANLDPTGSFSLSTWVKTTQSLSGGTYAAIAGKGFLATTNGYGLFLSGDNSSKPYFQARTGATIVSASGPSVNDGNWHLLTGVRDHAGNTTYLYIDGQLVGTGAGALTNYTSSESFAVGARNMTGWDHYYAGAADEVRFYNRILTAAEIKSLYDVGQSDKVNSSASQPQGTGRLDSGLAGYWKFDEGTGSSVTDSSTNGNTGSVDNMEGGDWVTGQLGGALDFETVGDGNERVNIPDSGAILDPTTITLSAWIKPESSHYGNFISKGYNAHYRIRTDLTTNTISFLDRGTTNMLTSTGTVTIGSWNHVVGVGDSSGLKIYINGVLAGSNSTAFVGSPTDSNSLEIGLTNGSNEIFDGSIDEVRIYNRALSSEEVAQLYRLNVPSGTDTSLKGYWSFNGKDMSGTTAYDRSGAGNNGTLTNGPTITEGKIGQGLNFDGTDDYVTAGTGLNITGAISIGVWAKTNATKFQCFVSNRGGGYAFCMRGSLNSYRLRFTYFTVQDWDSSINAYSADNNWHYYVVTNDTVNTKFYVDGALFSTTSGGSGVSSSDSLMIGDLPSIAGSEFNGSLDEIRIYNHALSATEIASLYNASR